MFNLNKFSFKSLISPEGFSIFVVLAIEYLLFGFTIYRLIIVLPIIMFLFIHKQKLSLKSLFYSIGLLVVSSAASRMSLSLYENNPASIFSSLFEILDGFDIFYILGKVALLSIFMTIAINRHVLSVRSLIFPLGYVVIAELLKLTGWEIAAYIASFELTAVLASIGILFYIMRGFSVKSLIASLIIPVSLAILYGILFMNEGFGFSVLLPIIALAIVTMIFVAHYTFAFVFQFWSRMFKKCRLTFGKVNYVATRYGLLAAVCSSYFIVVFYWVSFGLEIIQPYDFQGAVYVVPFLITCCSLVMMVRRLSLNTSVNIISSN